MTHAFDVVAKAPLGMATTHVGVHGLESQNFSWFKLPAKVPTGK